MRATAVLVSALCASAVSSRSAYAQESEAPVGPEGPEVQLPSDILEQLEADAAGVEELLSNFGTNVPTTWQNFIDTSDCPTPFSGGYWRHAYIAPAQWKGAKWKFSAFACEWKPFANTTKLITIPNKIKEKYFPSTDNSYGLGLTADFMEEDEKWACRGKRWRYGAPVYKTGHLQAPDWKPIKCIVRFGEVKTLGSASWIRFETPWATWFNEYIATNAPFLAPALRSPDVQTAISTAQEENIEFEAGTDQTSEEVGVEFGPDGEVGLQEPESIPIGALPETPPLPPAGEETATEQAAQPTPLELLQQALGVPTGEQAKAALSDKPTPKSLSVGVPLNPVQATKQAVHNAEVLNARFGEASHLAYATGEKVAQKSAQAAVDIQKSAIEKEKEIVQKVAASEQYQKLSEKVHNRINASPVAKSAFSRYQAMKMSPEFQKIAGMVKQAAANAASAPAN